MQHQTSRRICECRLKPGLTEQLDLQITGCQKYGATLLKTLNASSSRFDVPSCLHSEPSQVWCEALPNKQSTSSNNEQTDLEITHQVCSTLVTMLRAIQRNELDAHPCPDIALTVRHWRSGSAANTEIVITNLDRRDKCAASLRATLR